MNTQLRLVIGTKDAVLAISGIIILALTIFFHWSVWEFVISEVAVCLAFYAGTKKQDKHVVDVYERMNNKK